MTPDQLRKELGSIKNQLSAVDAKQNEQLNALTERVAGIEKGMEELAEVQHAIDLNCTDVIVQINKRLESLESTKLQD